LVRDRIPVQIQRRGERVETISLADDELLDVLRAKLVEECLEVMSAGSGDALQEELSDVFEVLQALCRASGRSLTQIRKVAEEKRAKLGGFAKGIVLVETEEARLVAVKNPSGLFEPLKSTLKKSVPRTVVAAGRRPKTQLDRIIIPLIPSAPSRLRGPTRVVLRNSKMTFKIEYKEKLVEVILEQEESAQDDTQLLLPFANRES
jgi:predicted house-cleaning noncanonical NTP pyrophosphatase (MazG superfamily)